MSSTVLFRPSLHTPDWVVMFVVLCVHVTIRFQGLADEKFFPLSMLVLWPIPWMLANREGRGLIGLATVPSLSTGLLCGFILVAVSAAAAWGAFGSGQQNWLVQHAQSLAPTVDRLPVETAWGQVILIAIPSMLFSPLGEEFLFRGFLLTGLRPYLGPMGSNGIQSTAFALAHLAHFGLAPVQPRLLLVFLPSMFAAGWTFGWVRIRSHSLWTSIVAHMAYNLGLSIIAVWLL